jgi:hypothetical protein
LVGGIGLSHRIGFIHREHGIQPVIHLPDAVQTRPENLARRDLPSLKPV